MIKIKLFILILITFVFSCKGYRTVQYFNTFESIDSIIKTDSLPVDTFTTWTQKEFIGVNKSDSTRITLFQEYLEKNGKTYIFSVTKAKDSIINIKGRIE